MRFPGTQKTGPAQPSPHGEPARRAPADAPTTAYEYPEGDRGAHAAEHERQQRDVLRGPSREDAARGTPRPGGEPAVPPDSSG